MASDSFDDRRPKKVISTDKTFHVATRSQDPWQQLLRMLQFWKPNPSKFSAESLSQTLYNDSMGGDNRFLDMAYLVQNDREVMLDHEQEICKHERLASLELFDSAIPSIIDTLNLLSVSCTMVITPLTFMWDGRWQDPDSVPGGMQLLTFDLVMDIFYAIYLVLLLDTSFLHPTNRMEVITSWKVIRYRLCSPLYWIKWFSVTVYFWVLVFDVPLVLNIVKVVRGGIFIDLPDSWWRLRDEALVRMAIPVVLLMGASHWVACVLHCYGGFWDQLENKGPEALETEFRGHIVNGWVSSYTTALIEAAGMLTGTLDGPTGDGARDGQFGALVLVAIFVPIGQLVVAFFIAAIVQEYHLGTALDLKHKENKAFVERAVQILNIPPELQRRVFSMHYFQKMSHDNEALRILFNSGNLSSSLSSALKIYLYRESVLCSPYLAGKDPNYIIEVIKILADVVCLPGEYIARRGEVASQMYFVARGTLSVLIPDLHAVNNVMKAKQVKTLCRSDYFGDVALLKDSVRTAWIRADSYSLMSSLSRHDIEPIWKYFPEEKQELAARVAEFAERDRKRAARDRWQDFCVEHRGKLRDMRKAQLRASSRAGGGRMSALAANDVVPDENGETVEASIEDAIVSGDSATIRVDGTGSAQQLLGEVLQRQAALESKVEAQNEMLIAALKALGVHGVAEAEPASEPASKQGPAAKKLPKRKAKQPEKAVAGDDCPVAGTEGQVSQSIASEHAPQEGDLDHAKPPPKAGAAPVAALSSRAAHISAASKKPPKAQKAKAKAASKIATAEQDQGEDPGAPLLLTHAQVHAPGPEPDATATAEHADSLEKEEQEDLPETESTSVSASSAQELTLANLDSAEKTQF